MESLGPKLNVMEVQEGRLYTALAFAAYKNHPTCLIAVIKHAQKYNTEKDAPLYSQTQMAKWINKATDEDFTALHFAAYYGNIRLII